MLTPAHIAAVGEALLASFRHNFRAYKSLADRALAQPAPAATAPPVSCSI